MAGFNSFEEIKAWQKARVLANAIYHLTAKGEFSKDFGLKDQIRRSSVSIMANIAEGYGRRTNYDFASFLTIAHGSAAETQSHLYFALDQGYLSQDKFTELYTQTDEVSKMVMALAQHLRKTSNRK